MSLTSDRIALSVEITRYYAVRSTAATSSDRKRQVGLIKADRNLFNDVNL